MRAEGIPVSSGYGRLNEEPFIKSVLNSRQFRRIYTEQEINSVLERSHCPENNRLCEEAAWLGQTTLLGSRADMDQIAAAVRKVQEQAASLA